MFKIDISTFGNFFHSKNLAGKCDFIIRHALRWVLFLCDLYVSQIRVKMVAELMNMVGKTYLQHSHIIVPSRVAMSEGEQSH